MKPSSLHDHGMICAPEEASEPVTRVSLVAVDHGAIVVFRRLCILITSLYLRPGETAKAAAGFVVIRLNATPLLESSQDLAVKMSCQAALLLPSLWVLGLVADKQYISLTL